MFSASLCATSGTSRCEDQNGSDEGNFHESCRVTQDKMFNMCIFCIGRRRQYYLITRNFRDTLTWRFTKSREIEVTRIISIANNLTRKLSGSHYVTVHTWTRRRVFINCDVIVPLIKSGY